MIIEKIGKNSPIFDKVIELSEKNRTTLGFLPRGAFEQKADEIILNYSNGIKKKTVLKIEPSEYGSKLTITDNYDGLSEEEHQLHMHEVDKSLINWADYLQRFLITWNKWSKFGLWRWYMKRIWQPMKPAGRRITYMLLWITLVEVALITLGVGVYLSEFR